MAHHVCNELLFDTFVIHVCEVHIVHFFDYQLSLTLGQIGTFSLLEVFLALQVVSQSGTDSVIQTEHLRDTCWFVVK